MSQPARRPLSRAEALSLSAALTVLAIALPSSGYLNLLHEDYAQKVPGIGYHYHRFADRYHSNVLSSRRQVANAVRYVLGNYRHHAREYLPPGSA